MTSGQQKPISSNMIISVVKDMIGERLKQEQKRKRKQPIWELIKETAELTIMQNW